MNHELFENIKKLPDELISTIYNFIPKKTLELNTFIWDTKFILFFPRSIKMRRPNFYLEIQEKSMKSFLKINYAILYKIGRGKRTIHR